MLRILIRCRKGVPESGSTVSSVEWHIGSIDLVGNWSLSMLTHVATTFDAMLLTMSLTHWA